MENFKKLQGFRITGDVISTGASAAVADVDVLINGKVRQRLSANRISIKSYSHGGSLYAGFEYTVPLKFFRGDMCVVEFSDVSSGEFLAEIEFDYHDFVFEQILLQLEYGREIFAEQNYSVVQLTKLFKNILPDYLEIHKNDRSTLIGTASICMNWLQRLIDNKNHATALHLLVHLDLRNLIRADVIKLVQLFMYLALGANDNNHAKLQKYLEKYKDLEGSDAYTMLQFCLRRKNSKKPVKLLDLKKQLKSWGFSSQAMKITFTFAEIYLDEKAMLRLKKWAMAEWVKLFQ